MSIPNIFTDADILFRNGREMHKNHPEVFDPSKVYEENVDNQKIVKKKRSRIVVPVPLRKTLEELQHGFTDNIAHNWFQTCAKLHRVYDGDPRKVVDVKKFDSALRRLDVGRPSDPPEKVVRNLGHLMFRGYGRKTGPLLIIWYMKYGFVKGIDESDILLPFDTHAFKFAIGRGVTNIDEKIKKDTFVRYAQPIYRDTFRKYEINPMDFHYAQWINGHENCRTGDDCYERKVNGERACPFPEKCKVFFDEDTYRTKGFVSKQLDNF
jgi:hypothetical protein